MMPSNTETFDQKSLRRKFLTIRDRLSEKDLSEKSLAIQTRLMQLEELQQSRTVMFYASFRSEVRTGVAIARCLDAGKRVALPLSESAGKRLLPYLVEVPDRDLRPGYCSIPEPDPSRTKALDPAELDVVVVPGSVFDLQGGRLGYGGGYYDRFLERDAPRALRIGVAFELQLVAESLPLAPHDQLMHCLVTEDRTFFTNQG